MSLITSGRRRPILFLIVVLVAGCTGVDESQAVSSIELITDVRDLGISVGAGIRGPGELPTVAFEFHSSQGLIRVKEGYVVHVEVEPNMSALTISRNETTFRSTFQIASGCDMTIVTDQYAQAFPGPFAFAVELMRKGETADVDLGGACKGSVHVRLF